MDLVTFLLARIGEDEEAARVASPGPWSLNAEGDEVLAVDGITAAEGFALSNRQQRATADHIARWDPARVLAECEAKRRIVALHEPTFEYPGAAPMCGQCGSGRQASGPGDPGDFEPEPWPCPTLDLLALPYADHPDFQPVRRPEETAHQ